MQWILNFNYCIDYACWNLNLYKLFKSKTVPRSYFLSVYTKSIYDMNSLFRIRIIHFVKKYFSVTNYCKYYLYVKELLSILIWYCTIWWQVRCISYYKLHNSPVYNTPRFIIINCRVIWYSVACYKRNIADTLTLVDLLMSLGIFV